MANWLQQVPPGPSHGYLPETFIGALKKEKEKKKEKDNQYKLKKATAIAIGLKKMKVSFRVKTSLNLHLGSLSEAPESPAKSP